MTNTNTSLILLIERSKNKTKKAVKNYFTKITFEDPYPKIKEGTIAANTPEMAAYKAMKEWRKNEMARRQIKRVSIFVEYLSTKSKVEKQIA